MLHTGQLDILDVDQPGGTGSGSEPLLLVSFYIILDKKWVYVGVRYIIGIASAPTYQQVFFEIQKVGSEKGDLYITWEYS